MNSAAWTHNTSMNRLGYTPLPFVTGKSCNLPGLTIGNEVIESVLDTEEVQKVMARILKTQAEFRESEIRMKIKDCKGV